MINLQIIDNSNQIKPSLSGVEFDISFYDDEVEALNAVEKSPATVILLNYALRRGKTADYIKLILNISPDSKIVLIADALNENEIVECLLAGAKGYQDIKQLELYAIKLSKVIKDGEAWISRRMVAILLDSLIRE